MTAHAKLSASSSKRWLSCPASVPLSEGIIRTTSKFAAEGTAAHALGEYCLKNDFLDPYECIGFTAEQLGEDFADYVVDEDMAFYLRIYVDTIKNDHLISFGGEAEIGVETQVHLKHLETEVSGPLFGTNDCSMVVPFSRLGVYDLKYGKGVEVMAEDNTQGLYYCLGAWIAADRTPDEIEVVIIQPRLDDYNARVKRWEFSSDVLEAYEQTLIQGIDDVRQATEIVKWAADEYNCDFADIDASEQLNILKGLLAASEDACKFCPIKATCPKIFEDTMSIAMADFEPEEEVALVPVKELTNKQTLLILNNAKRIIDYVKSVQEHSHNEALAGTEVPDHKLIRGKSNRIWAQDEGKTVKALNKLAPKHKAKIKFTETKVISPAQFEKLAGKGVADHLITKPEGKLTLVKNSHKGQAVKPAHDDFAELTDDGEDLDDSLFE